MSITTAAQQLLTGPQYRFTIREIGRGDRRKGMTAARFLAKRDEYRGRVGIRVLVVDNKTCEAQTWNLDLTKRFWA